MSAPTNDTDRLTREKMSRLMDVANELSKQAMAVFERHKIEGGGDVMGIVALFAANLAIWLAEINGKDPLVGIAGLQQLIDSNSELLLVIRAEARKAGKL